MSGAAMKWARGQNVHSAPLKSIVNAIAAHADANGVTWVSQATLAAETNMGERTVRRHLALLEKLGVLTRQVRSGGRKGRLSDLLTLALHRTFDLSARDVSAAKAAVAAESSNRPLSTVPTGQRWPGNIRGNNIRGQPEGGLLRFQGKALHPRGAQGVRLAVVNGGFVDDGEIPF